MNQETTTLPPMPKIGTIVRVLTRHPRRHGPYITHVGRLVSAGHDAEGKTTIYYKKDRGAVGQVNLDLRYVALRRYAGISQSGNVQYIDQHIPLQNVVSVLPDKPPAYMP